MLCTKGDIFMLYAMRNSSYTEIQLSFARASVLPPGALGADHNYRHLPVCTCFFVTRFPKLDLYKIVNLPN